MECFEEVLAFWDSIILAQRDEIDQKENTWCGNQNHSLHFLYER